MSKRYFITTPIYYVNSVPHVGTTLTSAICDMLARHRRMKGEQVLFLTGTDENGTKVAEAARKAGKEPQAFVDDISLAFRHVFTAMNIRFDDFIRTTEPRHVKAAQRLFEVLREKGHIYLDTYEGWYDVSSESFVRESDLIDGKSPDGNPVEWVSEQNYFFRLSAFGDRLLEHIEKNPGFLIPESRKNEVVSFIKQGLRDMSITRQNAGWGIPVPGDESKVIYVWFDALINYLAATGWPDEGWEATWPADLHLMAKEIFTRFHATLWPAMLMAADLPLPKHVMAHGWFTFGEGKMSKSQGNTIAPLELADTISTRSGCTPEISIDVVRYSLAALLPYEGDTNFSEEEVERRYNSDLANDLGNALNRTLAMTHKFVDGKVPDAEPEPEALAAVRNAVASYDDLMNRFRIDLAVDEAIGLARFLNKYIDSRAPWALAKAGDSALPAVLRSMLLCIRTLEGLIRPIMPATADAFASQLALGALSRWDQVGQLESLPVGSPVGQPQPIFPRLEVKKKERVDSEPQPRVTQKAQEKAKDTDADKEATSLLSIDEFAKVALQVGRVMEAEPIEGSDKLLKLQVLIGQERRQIVAGIRTNYDPLDLIGRQVVVVMNLKPAKLRGVESQGMLLAAVDEAGGAILLQPDREAPEGAKVR
jgi:methionyl-tRNA synthetase